MEGKNEDGGWQADKTPSRVIQNDSWLIFTFLTSVQARVNCGIYSN